VIHSAAFYLSDAFVQEDFDFYGRTLSGTPQLRERWKRGGAGRTGRRSRRGPGH
jgi:putative endopeptidase